MILSSGGGKAMAIKNLVIKDWRDPLNLILGLWMVVSPWVLENQVEANVTWDSVIFGILIAAVAVLALYRVITWKEWANGLLGVLLLGSPWIFGFSGAIPEMRNDVFVGIALVLLAALWAFDIHKDSEGGNPTT
jgi:multisubunit Na+/H+ antiporter MnhF subunit